MRWYFTPTKWLPIKLLLLAWLVYALVMSLAGGGIKVLALMRALLAVFGGWGLIIVAFTVPITLALTFFPAFLYFVQLAVVPTIWRKEGSSVGNRLGRSLALLVGLAIVAWLVSGIAVQAIAFVADLDPCASFRAGVTGKVRPPASCE